MKKILSVLVIAAMLLTALCVSASAGTFYERNDPAISYKDAKYQVRQAQVTIDGVITPGEYDEWDNYCEWYIGEMASDAYVDAQKMAETIKWYFSWDGKEYFHIGVVADLGSAGITQEYPAGTYFGDYALEEVLVADEFLGFGPGLNVNSEEISPDDDGWSRFNFAVSENTASGQGIIGYYSGQNGQAGSPYLPVHGQDSTSASTALL